MSFLRDILTDLFNLSYMLMAEAFWVVVGGVVGTYGVFFAAQYSRKTGADAAAFGFFPMFTGPSCAMISGLVAIIMQLLEPGPAGAWRRIQV